MHFVQEPSVLKAAHCCNLNNRPKLTSKNQLLLKNRQVKPAPNYIKIPSEANMVMSTVAMQRNFHRRLGGTILPMPCCANEVALDLN